MATLVVLEGVLSFDNAAILTVLSRMVPDARDRRRALNYGLAIAYVLRIAAILAVFILLTFPIFLFLGGLYLLTLAWRHFWAAYRQRGETAPTAAAHRARGGTRPWLAALGVAPFTAIIVQIGVVDLMFALDQVVAAFGFTREKALIIVAAGIGLASLRLLSPYISRLMDWLPVLEHMAYVAVGFVGFLLLVGPATTAWAPPALKAGATLSLFAVPIAYKAVRGLRRTP
ncbi:MAG: TerC family protein [Thermoplasmatota archaeon]